MGIKEVESEGLQVVDVPVDDGLQVYYETAPEVYHNRPRRASDTNSLEEEFADSLQKEKCVVALERQSACRSHSRKGAICGTRRRWFWLALIFAVVILVAITTGIVVGVSNNHSKGNTNNKTSTPETLVPTTTTKSIGDGTKLAAIAYNDTNDILQRRVYYQDSSNNIRESSWNASSEMWHVSNKSILKAKPQSPIAASATGLPEFSSPQINLYTLDSSNLVNEYIMKPLSPSSTWSPGSLNTGKVQAASTSNLVAISHSLPGCFTCYNQTILIYEDSSDKLIAGRGNLSAGWTWDTLSASPIPGSGLGMCLRWYSNATETVGLRLWYQTDSEIELQAWDADGNDTDVGFTNWRSAGRFDGSSSSSNTSIIAFAYGYNVTTGPENLEVLSSSSYGVTNYPWQDGFEDTQNPSVMDHLDPFTPLAADQDGRVYGMQSGTIKEFMLSTDGKSTWTLVGDVAIE